MVMIYDFIKSPGTTLADLLNFMYSQVWFLNLLVLMHEFCFFMQGITLVILTAHVIFPVSYEGFNLYWKNNLHKAKASTLLSQPLQFMVFQTPEFCVLFLDYPSIIDFLSYSSLQYTCLLLYYLSCK